MGGVTIASGVSAVGYSPASTSGVNNAKALYKTRTALAKVLAGTAQMKVAFIGDSTTAGRDASAGLAGQQAWSAAQQFAKRATARGLPARADSVMGTQSYALTSNALQNAYDPRLTAGANVFAVGFQTFGYRAFSVTAGAGLAADTLSFTPAGAFDTLEIYTMAAVGFGTIAVNIDGGATVVTINTNQSSQLFQKTTQAVTRVTGGSHAINLVCTGKCYIVGVLAYDSTTPAVNCLNFGWDGGSIANLMSPANNYPAAPAYASVANVSGLGCYSPDLTVIYLGINDLGQGTSLASFLAYLEQLVAAAQVTGDCVLMTMWGNTQGTDAQTQSYNAQIAAAAAAMNISYIDQYPLYGGLGHGQTLGLLGADNVHPTHAGYADRGNVLANFIVNMT